MGIKLTVYVALAGPKKVAFDRHLTNNCAGFTVLAGEGHWKDSEGILWTEPQATYIFLLDYQCELVGLLKNINKWLAEHTEEECIAYDVVETDMQGIREVKRYEIKSGPGLLAWVMLGGIKDD